MFMQISEQVSLYSRTKCRLLEVCVSESQAGTHNAMMHIGNFLPTEFEDYQSGIYNVRFKSGSRNSKVLVPVIRTKKGGYRCYSQKIDPCEESASTTSSCSPKYALTFIAKKEAQSEWIWDWL